MTMTTNNMNKRIVTRDEKLQAVYDDYRREVELRHLQYKQVLVPGMGSLRPKVVFVGETPSEQEALMCRPLAGNRLVKMRSLLMGIDLKPEHIFITHLVKYRTPNGRDPRGEEGPAALPYLLREIQILRPKIVVTWGRYMHHFLRSDTRFEHVHGTALDTALGFKFIPMFSPDAATQNPHVAKMLVDDFQSIRKFV